MHPIPQRLKAARALAGYSSQAKLGRALDPPIAKFGGRSIRAVEEGRRDFEPHEREAVAKACGIDPAFFEIDLSQLRTTEGQPAGESLSLSWLLREAALQLEQGRGQDEPGQDEQDRPRP